MKVTATISVQADSLEVIVAEALKELNALHTAEWTIDDIKIWSRQDAASKNEELVTIWSAEVAASATVDLTS